MNECFPNERKKTDIITAYKKGQKQVTKNYRAVSLLPICIKNFEQIIFDCLFKYLEYNKLLTWNRSGFRPGDSCVHHLLSITHEIYKSSDANLKRDLFDISEASDRIWQDKLLYKLKLLGIFGRHYNSIQLFLNNRHFTGRSQWSIIKMISS